MLKLNLEYIFRIRAIKNPYGFIKKLGFSHDVCHRLAHGQTLGVKMNQLEALCLALHCTPNDLMEFKDLDNKVSSDHPMNALIRDSATLDSMDKLRKLPLDKIELLQKMMENLE
ncbi:helix-turn-helix transcriptional regulator [Reichenbachiella agarivorans]|uniref:Helix-turn-helix transcriptional regulator n=1 Tax=Reichenbachiella agarivorans TaxID=2979464 RepID=A0ABY6CU48_9BACT|nr:helix-turn-helix transcriptional regulator [Reichenbachiella agarivorans]UXP34040.1 helix-turn-helix transcriptional regulator [Reichenbachiella agarivorans]